MLRLFTMYRLLQDGVGLKRDQLIGINALTITIARSWMEKIREYHGSEPKCVKLVKRDDCVWGKLMFDDEEDGVAIRKKGADGKTYYFHIDRFMFEIFPIIKRGKFDKFFAIVELMSDYSSLRWYNPTNERIAILQNRKNVNRGFIIKKIESFIRYLENILMFSGFVNIEIKRAEINTRIKQMRNYNPALQDLELL